MPPWGPLLLLLLCPCVCALKICAFNAQHFGEKKVAKDHVLTVIVQILRRCDICLLQEVHDTKGLATAKLLGALNRPHTSDLFLSVSSPPLGRNAYVEQYVFVYRSDKVKVTDQYKYADNDPSNPDVFAREPYIIRVSLPSTALLDLVLVPQHTDPDTAAAEINALYDVFLDIRGRWRAENIMFLGDFNAGCKYLSKKKRSSLRLYSDLVFHWLIGDSADTTVRESTNCPYDRIVVYGKELQDIVHSATIYNFTRELGLSEAQALEVSDHYPVEVDLDGCERLLSSCSLIGLSLLAACGMGLSP
ncbi:deoxyribonuclease-1-like 1 [Ascaphus truei]|uniref:deoxyribonuclease-1-like 1 n=1 Tax=Ascaphus truei TaxID=8439 RepID=UPI003F5A4794